MKPSINPSATDRSFSATSASSFAYRQASDVNHAGCSEAAESSDEIEENLHDDEMVVLSLLAKGTLLGAAAYIAGNGKILLLEDSLIKGLQLKTEDDLKGSTLADQELPQLVGTALPPECHPETQLAGMIDMRELEFAAIQSRRAMPLRKVIFQSSRNSLLP